MVEFTSPHRKLSLDEKRFCQEQGIPEENFCGLFYLNGNPRVTKGYRLETARPLDDKRRIVVQIDCLELSSKLRFGNFFVALANAYRVAKHLGITEVIFPSNESFREEFLINGVRFSTSSISLNRLKGQFFHNETLPVAPPVRIQIGNAIKLLVPALRSVPRFRIGELTLWAKARLKELRKRLQKDLTIHIRSGDIFAQDVPHPGYWQPPLAFYISVINQVGPRHVTLVFEDRGNPVIDKIEEHLQRLGVRVSLRGGVLSSALEEIQSARDLVVARGTFSRPLVAASISIRNLYLFGQTNIYAPLERGISGQSNPRVYDYFDSDFEKKVSPWIKSESQLSSMLSFKLAIEQPVATEWFEHRNP